MNEKNGNRGVDPKPERGNDEKGHRDNGKGPKFITTKPGRSHSLTK